MSQQEFARFGKELEQIKGALQAALARIAALESKKDSHSPASQVAALLNASIPAEIKGPVVDKRKKEWRDKFRPKHD